MNAKRAKDRSGEVRLEGVGLVLVGGVILAAIVGAFFLGAWVERRAHGPVVSEMAEANDPLAPLGIGDDVRMADAGMDAFDRLDPGAAEPEREIEPVAAPARPEPEPAREAAVETAAKAAGGPFWAQVFAGRDRRAADRLASELETSGYPVRVASIAQGSSTLYKVRVGGYEDEARARSIARELVRSGYAGTWVTRVDG